MCQNKNNSDPSKNTGTCGSCSNQEVSRKQALGTVAASLGAGAALASSLSDKLLDKNLSGEAWKLEFQEHLKSNYRVMTSDERDATVQRLIRLAEINQSKSPNIQSTDAIPGVLYGYAFNISRCKGYRDCIRACIQENNQDRDSGMQYIRIFEMENGKLDLESGKADYFHEVPAAGHFYLGTQCFQCENPPCVDVCPVGATWKEPDGITVIDYDWCIGCRYCEAACPYWGRRFNWSEPEVPESEVNDEQHYLGNRPRSKGVMEKCTFCVQKTRNGQQPACAEACPNGARVFGNLLDPDSEIRYILKHKKVFRLKEDLGTEPKFWYFMD